MLPLVWLKTSFYAGKLLQSQEAHKYIRDQKQIATQRFDPTKVMSVYSSCMQSLCQNENADFASVIAILQGTAHAWGVARDVHKVWAEQGATQQQAHLHTVLVKLPQMLPGPAADMGTTSIIFCSFGQMGVNPNDLVPDVINSLAQHFSSNYMLQVGHHLPKC